MSVTKPIMKPEFWIKWRKLVNPERQYKIVRDEQAAAFVLRCLEASTEFAALSEDIMVRLCPVVEDLDVVRIGIDMKGNWVVEETFELEMWKAITDKVPEDVLLRVIDKAIEFQEERKK
jgi:hypothetical protein